ncbi:MULTISPECIES: RidA family protein [unclassified Sphingopyxis]|uniref:RidA family protein n=1 Tax=unclassified Sphingopyxis TaxID=2614943 RepID=UPI000A570651|nr:MULTISPECIES: RidA family protein [unclassified Sphingopyxis]
MRSPYAALAAAALALPFAAPAAARQPADVIMPVDPQARAFQEEVGFADAVIAGDTIYLSGVVAAPRAGEAGLEPALERVFVRIAEVLARAGASWDDVVEMTTFHTDLPSQIDAFVAVKNRHVKGPPPAWTAIGIARLYEPTAIVEVKVIARKPKG